MKVRVDKDLFVGDESCVNICPEAFQMQDDTATTKMDVIPPGLEKKCREALEACPVESILVRE